MPCVSGASDPDASPLYSAFLHSDGLRLDVRVGSSVMITIHGGADMTTLPATAARISNLKSLSHTLLRTMNHVDWALLGRFVASAAEPVEGGCSKWAALVQRFHLTGKDKASKRALPRPSTLSFYAGFGASNSSVSSLCLPCRNALANSPS